MKPGREDADEQSGQKYQMHDSYLITEISQYQHINAVNSLRPIVTGKEPCRRVFFMDIRRHRVAAAAVAAEDKEEDEEEEGG